MQHEYWQQPMQEKLDAFTANHTWDILQCPPSVKPIGCKRVYSIKLKPNGSLDRYKAWRLLLATNKNAALIKRKLLLQWPK